MGTALVTGASAGLGRAFATELARRGHDLVLVARDQGRLEELAEELRREYAVTAEVLPADLADRDQTERVAERLRDAERPVDLLVNNAGFGLRRSFSRGDLADEERAVDVMVRAVLVLSHAAAGAMRTRGRGGILNVSSVASFAVMGTYSAIKSWVTVFTEALSVELQGTGVTATAVCPGFVHTEFHDRALMNMSALPDPLWLTADQVVTGALRDLDAGRAVSVPSLTYKAVTTGLKVVPRGAVRRVSGLLAQRRRTARERAS
ncbi:SDR family NAD(P)-dependent oxidoreductase [Ornithinimicrobium sp. F0845]|uniref:SDR family NAD(P)-dependent oxidoreductase n=1 Tax=Ornithinimicrobium sp. F0845 TaxID=2926412 RepID=UPI001FF35A95|nr:SDR family NAD(P)-dependent oxidoreductase [Ornithinimicrobium sp. F0845]MCK0113011.1 SDR family NAD(P)-dependent oxidoreductase [Ornithinimicrobium sp. F0845]